MSTRIFFVLFLLILTAPIASVRAADEAAPATQPGATTQPAEKLEASNFDALKAAVDKTVTVTGTIARTGWSPRGNILFINFEGIDRNGFGVVVPKDNKDAVAAHGEDAAALVGKQVEITGKIVLYREKPQIQIATADQIKVVGEAATKPAEPPAQ